MGAFALTFTALKDHYRAQSILIETLLDKEKRLAKSETMLRTLFDAVPDIVTLTRFSDGKVIETNDELLRRTGLTREQALSTSVTRAGAWVRPEERDEYIRQLKQTGRVRNLEVDFRLNGVVAPYLMSSVSVEMDGELYALNVARDAAQVRENERALREARERLSAQVEELTATQVRLRAEVAEREAAERVAHERETTVRKVFEASPDIITVSSRIDFRLIQANSTFFRETGYSPQEVLGQQVYMKFWANPAQREQLKQALDRDGFAHNMEADLTMKDGTINSYLLSTVAVELSGEPCRVSFWRNITEAKRAAQRVADSEAILRRTVRRHTRHNHHAARGRGDRRERGIRKARRRDSRRRCWGIRSRRPPSFFAPRTARNFFAGCAPTASSAISRPTSKSKAHAVPYLVSGAMIETEDGPIIFSISRDISSRIEMERELVAARETALAASRAKSEFLSSMSHEIRTPMNAILGMADLLSDGALDPEQRRYIDTMRSNGNALLHLINDILDVAKIESGRLSLESVSFDLEDTVGKAIETMSVRAHAKGLELTARILPHVPPNLIGDPLRLRQILINLTANAVKFTDQGEVALTVESLSPAEALRLGFAANAGRRRRRGRSRRLAALFGGRQRHRNRRGGARRDLLQLHPGRRLGLAPLRRLRTRAYDRAASERDDGRAGRGRERSRPRFDFPRHRRLAGRHPAGGRLEERGAAINLDGVRILVVDDNETNRLILREMLVRNRAEVTEAAGGAAALAELAHARAAGPPVPADAARLSDAGHGRGGGRAQSDRRRLGTGVRRRPGHHDPDADL